MSHTDGPWWVDGPGEGIEVHDTFGRTASVWGEQGDGDEAWANAQLISAAPDLLAACRLLLASLVDWCEVADPDDQRDDDYLAIDAAKAAIAKAEGVTTEGTNGEERSLD